MGIKTIMQAKKILIVASGEDKADIVRTMSKKVEMIFGRKIKLSEVTEDQVDLLYLALLDLRDLRDSMN